MQSTPLTESLAGFYLAQEPRLRRALQRSFPRMCPGRIEDALREACLASLESPEAFEAALLAGEDHLFRLYLTVAWRGLRAQWRRSSYRLESGGRALNDAVVGVSPGQEAALILRLQLAPLIAEAAERFCPADPEALQGALETRLQTGCSDTAVAREHGVRREYLNRARNWVRRELAA